MRKISNHHGFTPLHTILAVVAVGLIVGTGWYVWQFKSKTSNSTDQGASAAKSDADVKDFASCKAAGNPIQESYPEVCAAKDGKSYPNPDHVKDQASAEDDMSIKRTILGHCESLGAEGGSAVDEKIESNMKDPNLYVKDGSFARLSAGCDVEGGGFRAFLQKKNGIWTILGTGQMNTISCSKLDGTGIPKTVASTCYDENGNERAVKS